MRLSRIYAILSRFLVDMTFPEVAQFAHFGMYGFLTLLSNAVGLHYGLPHLYIYISGALVFFGAVKEIWDVGYETAATSGLVRGSILDFSFMCLGVLSADLTIVFLTPRP